MKNLLRQNFDFENYGTRKETNYVDRWTYHNWIDQKVKGVNVWKFTQRFVETNVGKEFDYIFSKYCMQVPKHFQHYFLEYFQPRYGWRGSLYNDHYVDNDGLIQRYKPLDKYKGPYYFYSPDYKVEYAHKITGKPVSEYPWTSKKYKESDFIPTIVSGYRLRFEHENDPRFIRLKAEKEKAKRKEKREQERVQKVYLFEHPEEEKKL
jgi:hypothetical protein